MRTSLNPNSLNRSLILPWTSSNRVDSGGSTSRVPGVVANFLGVVTIHKRGYLNRWAKH